MPDTMELAATASPEAIQILNQGLAALQSALRRAMANRPSATARNTGLDTELHADLDAAFAAYDAYLAHVVSAHPMSCKTGCVACCHDNPRGVTGIEALRLKNALSSSQRDAIRASAQAALQAGSQNPRTWRAQNVPCPLLQDNRCQQYQARPIACRAFYAHSPAEWCSPSHPRYASRVNPHLDPPKVYLQILSAISDILGLGPTRDLHSFLAEP